MLNPVKLHDGLWSIGLASMFNWSPTSGSRREPCEGGGGGGGESEKLNSSDGGSGSVKDLRQGQQNFDPSALYHHFPFATNFNLLTRSETCQKSIMKNSGGKSFTIDSLLGINAAQVAIQSRIHAAENRRGDESSDGGWTLEKHSQLDHVRENRTFHPRKERHAPYARASNSDKIGEKPLKNSRRTTKSKRVRTIFTPEQLERLESEFERQQYMVGPERLYLASTLYLTEAQVKVWFQNRRIKWRKQHLEMQQQRLAIFRSQSSHVDTRGDDIFEDDESEGDDVSQSHTPPPSDFSPTTSSCVPPLSIFTESIAAQGHQLPMECSPSPRNYPRRVPTTQECNKISGFNHNDHGGGCDSSSSFLAHSPAAE